MIPSPIASGDTLRVNAGPGTAAAFDGSGYWIVVVNHSLVPGNLAIALRLPRDRTIRSAHVEFNERGPDFYRFEADVLPAARWRLEGDDLIIHARRWPDTTCGWRWTRLSHRSESSTWRSRPATRSWSS